MNTQCIDAPASTHPSVFTARESSIIKKAMTLIEGRRLRDEPILYYYDDFQRYLILRFAGLVVEEFHVLYLDSSRRLIAAETVAVGDQKSVAPDFRHVAYRAIGLGADSVVVAHNHPSDNPEPSDADIRQLEWSEKALGWLNITLLDSYVVTSQGITSIKAFRKQQDEAQQRRWQAEAECRSAARRVKIAATKAAKLAAQQGESHV